jgi:hypothetical protein
MNRSAGGESWMQNCKEKYGKELREERHKAIYDGQKHKDSQGGNRDMDSEGIRDLL